MSASVPSSATLHIYFIASPELPQREKNITQVIHWIKHQCDGKGLPTKFHSLTQPTTATMHDLVRAKTPALEERLQPSPPSPHPVYGKFNTPLNLAELSNYERHRTALEAIRSGSPTDYHLILEDDVYIIPAFEAAWGGFLDTLRARAIPADTQLVVFSMTQNANADPSAPFAYIPYSALQLTESRPLLPSKEMYMIHPTAAGQLYDYTHAIHCDFRHTLSRWVYSNLLLHASIYLPSKRLTFDGSKLGIFPSTIHANNLLIFNQEFMEMLSLLSTPEKKTKATVSRLYKTIERLQSPDAMHLYAVLMFQLGDYDEADAYFKKAVEAMTEQHGFMSRGTELLHNAIEFYKHAQKEEIAAAKSKPSRHRPDGEVRV